MTMHQTPWTKKASSLPSDRLRPKSTPPKTSRPSKSQAPDAAAQPKSKQLLELESLRAALNAQESSGASVTKDPKGGCFCQARTHPLSPYTPLCPSCALPLCALNLPSNLCPHCLSPLLSAPPLTPTRAALIARLDTEIAETTRKEHEAREGAEQTRRQTAGAFPTLASLPSPPPHTPPPPLQPQTHKVLSLNSKTKRVIVTTTTTTPPISRTASSSNPPSRPGTPPPVRTPAPPAVSAVVYTKGRVRPDGPYENLGLSGRGEDALVYIPPMRVGEESVRDTGGEGRRRRRGKGKAGEKENYGDSATTREGGGAEGSGTQS
ncbi:hypothetical protein Hypma_004121 [Hypsizygus marmoreus]|uniref:TRIP4/RQT4 C2HC5-type zinc finger domain-containing protein n=1 Tax=Hypsizygus marmoreus TaxID=39966 RepID=A0A369K6J5_HYPMA|nr:hypothetical protein Hypma_004121 [Hypsizygus marmoreus]